MKTQTSLVATNMRLQHWADQIKDCQSRPAELSVEDWCDQNGITKANYYYRLRRVREACLAAASGNEGTTFVELSRPIQSSNTTEIPFHSSALLHGPGNVTIEISSDASADFIHSLIGAFAYVK